jgi:predicted lipoprotein
MNRIFSAALAATLMFGSPSSAQDLAPVVADVVDHHVLPRVSGFVGAAAALYDTARSECQADGPQLQGRFHAAFDAWTGMSHLRFGPTETGDRAFAIAFWPDSRGVTPRALRDLLQDEDPALRDPLAFQEVSIAARGLYALEFLLFDAELSAFGSDEARCALVQAIARDVAGNAAQIDQDWRSRRADLLKHPGPGAPYTTDAEAAQELFKALGTGLQFTADTRLGRPIGTFDRPRPTRAEARRSGRSLRQVELSVASARDLALRLAAGNLQLVGDLTVAFDRVDQAAARIEDPVFAGVSDVQGRLRVEALQQRINEARALIAEQLGPELGVSAGFKSLDGD